MIARWDRAVVEAFQHVHWGPADRFFELLSDWWVKSLVIVGIVLLADLWTRGRRPLGAAFTTACYFAAAGISTVLKDAFDRARPATVDPAVHPLVATPHSYSMPSGHATTAFAAAVAAGLFHPRLRLPMLVLAALIAVSRVWLGVHYPTDVLAGAGIGSAVAIGAGLGVRAVRRRLGRPSR